MPDGVDVLLGNQRKGVVVLAIPLCLAFLIQQANSFIDTLWVSGLGSKELAAIGIVAPIYTALVGAGTGLGIGISSAISRSIGRGDRAHCDRVAGQGIILTVVTSIILTVFLITTAEPVLLMFGARDTINECLSYAYPLYICTLFLILSGVLSGMLRGEGAAKRSMYVQVLCAVLNMILDPIMIYGLGMGITGAAWATSISFMISIIPGIYWYLVRRNTFVSLKKGDFVRDRSTMKEIMSVGFPEMLELSIMNVFTLFLNFFIVIVGGTDAVAVYGVCMRVFMLLMTPAQAIGGALVSICSAEYGMRRFDMINDAFRFSIHLSLIITTILTIILCILNGLFTGMITGSSGMPYMYDSMYKLVAICAVSMIPFALVYVGSGLLQSLNKAGHAMVNTLFRNMFLVLCFAVGTYVIGTLDAVWYANIVAEIVGGSMMFIHARYMFKQVSARIGTNNPSNA